MESPKKLPSIYCALAFFYVSLPKKFVGNIADIIFTYNVKKNLLYTYLFYNS